MNEAAYRDGFERGNEGKSSASGFLDGLLDDEQDARDREDGYKAGLLAHAIRGDDE